MDPVLATKLQANREQEVRVIVHVRGDMVQASARLRDQGCEVMRSFQLIRAVAVRCTGAKALSLAKEPWVQKIEEDRQVSAQQP